MAFIFISIAAIIAALSVALGAFAAHGLQQHLSAANVEVFKTGVYYQFVHALALFILGVLILVLQVYAPAGVKLTAFQLTGVAWLIGIVLFSGSLYGLSVAEWRWLGPVTPIGGLSFIIGWVSLAVASFRLYGQFH